MATVPLHVLTSNPPLPPRPREAISVFDVFKIGVGPSSSHTMGPWRAAQRFLSAVASGPGLTAVTRVQIDLYGSLAKTGRGHATDLAVVLGLAGEDPVTCPTGGPEGTLAQRVATIAERRELPLGGRHPLPFDLAADLRFHFDQALPFHANGLTFTAFFADLSPFSVTYYSVGGGFVVEENEAASGSRAVALPFPIEASDQLKRYCAQQETDIPRIVLANERTWRPDPEIAAGLHAIWRVMQECIHRGCHTDGVLPGGLNVTRRAASMNRKLLSEHNLPAHFADHADVDGWLADVRGISADFNQVTKWVSTFALAVNEENASLGRVVTAPTNGAAGVIPAVMMYAWCFVPLADYAKPALATVLADHPDPALRRFGSAGGSAILDFMLVAGEIGSLFKKGATISAAMGGCQAEIGVSSAMAAAGLTQILGGSVGQVLMAAEIAMEHHLGMTCDPIAGLVQIPCIERNTMGAIKAITAAGIALESNPERARVSLDDVIKTMWDTAQDMQSKYKETAEGGLAVNVALSEC